MVSHAFTNRSTFDNRKLSVYMYRFFKNIKTKSRYIKSYVSLKTNDNNIFKLTDLYVIDLKKQDEVKTFKHNIYSNYNDFTKINQTKTIDNVIFNYIVLNRKQYLDQIDSIINNS